MRKKIVVFATCMAMVASFIGCDKDSDNKTTDKTSENSGEVVKLSDVSHMEDFVVEYKDTDEVPDWGKSNTKITLNNDKVEVSGKGAAYKDSVITITKAGYYVLSGKLADGKIVIEAGEKDKVYLILNGVEMSCSNDAVINETKADKVIITAVEGTENILSDGTTHSDEEITAAVYCKDSLTINGTGKLKVSGNFNDAITTKDNFKLLDAMLDITSVDDGIVGKDLVAVKSGSVNINATGDGVKSTQTDDIEKGIVFIDGGALNIVSELDAIQAYNYVKINDGVINITTGGGSDNESNSDGAVELLIAGNMPDMGNRPQGDMQMPEGENMPGGMREFETGESGNMVKPEMPMDKAGNAQMPEAPTGEDGNMVMPTGEDGNAEMPTNTNGEKEFQRGQGKKRGEWGNWGDRGGNMGEAGNTSSEDTPSAKGMKGGNGIYIAGGTINISSSDDAIHANDMVYIKDGVIAAVSGDDGIHADTTLDISGGTIDVSKSYEGLEGYYINVSGGDISVTSRDDGLNAAGGNDSSSVNGRQGQNRFSAGASDASINISGGTLKVTASGDGVDSNGSITMTGGEMIVCGPQSGGNGIVDFGDKFTMDGGIFLGAGTSGMFQSISTSSKLSVINANNVSGSAGDEIKIYDKDNKEIAGFTAETAYQAVIVSTPDLKTGSEYTIKHGDKETTVTAQAPVDYYGM